MAQQPPPPATVRDAMLAIGVSNVVNPQTHDSPAERLAAGIFQNQFKPALRISDKNIYSTLKQMASLTVAQGKVVCNPTITNGIRAFAHWCRHKFRRGENLARPLPLTRRIQRMGIGFGAQHAIDAPCLIEQSTCLLDVAQVIEYEKPHAPRSS